MARLRFTPLPHLPADMLGPMSYHPLADLYLRAHTVRWREMEITQRELCEAWGVPSRQVWRILDKLVDLGLANITKGSRRKPTLITVYDPTTLETGPDGVFQRMPKVDTANDQNGAKVGHHNYPDSSGDSGDSVSSGAKTEPGLGTTADQERAPPYMRLRPETELEPRPEQRSKAEVSSPTTADPGQRLGTPGAEPISRTEVAAALGGLFPAVPPIAAAAAWKSPTTAEKRKTAQRIYDAYRVHHPDEPEAPFKSDSGKIVARLTDLARQAKGKRPRYVPEDWATAERDLLDLVEWYHFAPRATWWREQDRLQVGTMFKANNFGDRIRDVNKWRTGGRSTEAAPTAGRKGANAHDFDDLSDLDGPPRDFIDVEVIERTSTQGGHRGH